MKVIKHVNEIILWTSDNPVSHCASAYLCSKVKEILFLSVQRICHHILGIHHMCSQTGRNIASLNKSRLAPILNNDCFTFLKKVWTSVWCGYIINALKTWFMIDDFCTDNLCSYWNHKLSTFRTDTFFLWKRFYLNLCGFDVFKHLIICCLGLSFPSMRLNFKEFWLDCNDSLFILIWLRWKQIKLTRKRLFSDFTGRSEQLCL